MIPVGVRKQHGQLDRLVADGVAELTQAGAAVDDEAVPVVHDLNARGVAPGAQDVGARDRDAPPHAPEPHLHQLLLRSLSVPDEGTSARTMPMGARPASRCLTVV